MWLNGNNNKDAQMNEGCHSSSSISLFTHTHICIYIYIYICTHTHTYTMPLPQPLSSTLRSSVSLCCSFLNSFLLSSFVLCAFSKLSTFHLQLLSATKLYHSTLLSASPLPFRVPFRLRYSRRRQERLDRLKEQTSTQVRVLFRFCFLSLSLSLSLCVCVCVLIDSHTTLSATATATAHRHASPLTMSITQCGQVSPIRCVCMNECVCMFGRLDVMESEVVWRSSRSRERFEVFRLRSNDSVTRPGHRREVCCFSKRFGVDCTEVKYLWNRMRSENYKSNNICKRITHTH